MCDEPCTSSSESSTSSDGVIDTRANKCRKISAVRSKYIDSNNWADRSRAAEEISDEDDSSDEDDVDKISAEQIIISSDEDEDAENEEPFYGEEKPLEDKSKEKVKSTWSPIAYETDVSVLRRRQKQIDYGKNTTEYERYLELIPKSKRRSRDTWTPNKYLKYSRRSWDSQIRGWRKALHHYDPESTNSDDERKDRIQAVMKLLRPILRSPNSNDVCCQGTAQE